MNPNVLQVLGLVALINTHKPSKARHSAELGSMPYRLRRSLSFKECFTILAGTFIVATATGVVVLTAVAHERNLQARNEQNG